MKSIIVEGVDGSGKTTLANRIIKVLNKIPNRRDGRYLHNGGPLHSQMQMWSRHKRSLDEQKRIIAVEHKIPIWDRNVTLSEYIYGTVLRQTWQVNQRHMFFALTLKYDPVIIYCQPPKSKILKAQKETHEAQLQKEHKPKDHWGKVLYQTEDLCQAYDEHMIKLAEYLFNEQQGIVVQVDPYTITDEILENFLCAVF